eukprot:CAMPEP_0117695480 /NCGR_PEP_ID=MMETSP0804-20121206/28161_1 /TAXON_ID=1074897 /ORGANISM="Tetraselmis astigmatica, Strain CCMP880" /LENGTH=131 /DNA_ID=CAMNT_0005509553 /DNA_START=490 /DNA_END=885 /DNA_ORIENTATION=-
MMELLLGRATTVNGDVSWHVADCAAIGWLDEGVVDWEREQGARRGGVPEGVPDRSSPQVLQQLGGQRIAMPLHHLAVFLAAAVADAYWPDAAQLSQPGIHNLRPGFFQYSVSSSGTYSCVPHEFFMVGATV